MATSAITMTTTTATAANTTTTTTTTAAAAVPTSSQSDLKEGQFLGIYKGNIMTQKE